MVKRVTTDDIKKMNELYATCHNYSQVAREVGFAPSTVKRYIIKDYQIVDESKILHFVPSDMPEFIGWRFKGLDNYGDLCVLSENEKYEIRELWKELAV